MRVLVADDDDAFRTILADVLRSNEGYVVTPCESGESALEALKKDQFDMIVLDYKMPGVSGLNVLQWIHEQKMETPVIMLTAAGNEEVAVEAMKLGAYDYIRKEYIEVDHLPIHINGVYERYLFRKEKERRDIEEKEREKNLAALKMFQETATSVTHFVNTSLSVLSLNVEEYERHLLPVIQKEKRQQLMGVFDNIKGEIQAVTTGVKSLLSLSSMVYQRFTAGQPAHDIMETVKKDVRTIEEEMKKFEDTDTQQINK
jgi:DNA-binding response OmpR family regulator